MTEPSFGGPYVQVACVCHTALQEVGGGLSVIRITDRVGVIGTTPQMQPQPLQNLSLVVLLKAGALRQSQRLKIVPVSPTGQNLPPLEMSVLFEGDDHGVALAMPLNLIATEDGLYWFDVLVEEQLVTRIPLRVVYQQAQMTPPFQPLPPSSSGA